VTTGDAEALCLARARLEIERTIARVRRRFPPGTRCASCRITNPIPMGLLRGTPLCYACRTGGRLEQHSLLGEHLPPRTATHPNLHRVLNEAQRIWQRAAVPGVREAVAINVVAFVVGSLAALGTLDAAS
jgi:hypothetical protein